MRRPRAAAVFLALAAAGTGCGSITAPTEGGRLVQARALWAARGPARYQYDVITMCECLEAGRWIRVEVQGNRVVGARYAETGEALEAATFVALPTIPMLFDRIQHAVAERAVLLEVEYDPADGHPTLINVDISRTIADEEYTLRSRHLAALTEVR